MGKKKKPVEIDDDDVRCSDISNNDGDGDGSERRLLRDERPSSERLPPSERTTTKGKEGRRSASARSRDSKGLHQTMQSLMPHPTQSGTPATTYVYASLPRTPPTNRSRKVSSDATTTTSRTAQQQQRRERVATKNPAATQSSGENKTTSFSERVSELRISSSPGRRRLYRPSSATSVNMDQAILDYAPTVASRVSVATNTGNDIRDPTHAQQEKHSPSRTTQAGRLGDSFANLADVPSARSTVRFSTVRGEDDDLLAYYDEAKKIVGSSNRNSNQGMQAYTAGVIPPAKLSPTSLRRGLTHGGPTGLRPSTSELIDHRYSVVESDFEKQGYSPQSLQFPSMGESSSSTQSPLPNGAQRHTRRDPLQRGKRFSMPDDQIASATTSTTTTTAKTAATSRHRHPVPPARSERKSLPVSPYRTWRSSRQAVPSADLTPPPAPRSGLTLNSQTQQQERVGKQPPRSPLSATETAVSSSNESTPVASRSHSAFLPNAQIVATTTSATTTAAAHRNASSTSGERAEEEAGDVPDMARIGGLLQAAREVHHDTFALTAPTSISDSPHQSISTTVADMASDATEGAQEATTLSLAGFKMADDAFMQDDSWRYNSDDEADGGAGDDSDDDFVVTEAVQEESFGNIYTLLGNSPRQNDGIPHHASSDIDGATGKRPSIVVSETTSPPPHHHHQQQQQQSQSQSSAYDYNNLEAGRARAPAKIVGGQSSLDEEGEEDERPNGATGARNGRQSKGSDGDVFSEARRSTEIRRRSSSPLMRRRSAQDGGEEGVPRKDSHGANEQDPEKMHGSVPKDGLLRFDELTATAVTPSLSPHQESIWGLSILKGTALGTPLPDTLHSESAVWGDGALASFVNPARWSPTLDFDLLDPTKAFMSTGRLSLGDIQNELDALSDPQRSQATSMQAGRHGEEGWQQRSPSSTPVSSPEKVDSYSQKPSCSPPDSPLTPSPSATQSTATSRHRQQQFTPSIPSSPRFDHSSNPPMTPTSKPGGVELVYDSVLNCYFSVATGEYFQLA